MNFQPMSSSNSERLHVMARRLSDRRLVSFRAQTTAGLHQGIRPSLFVQGVCEDKDSCLLSQAWSPERRLWR